MQTLAGPDYTQSDTAICRYAYTDVYRNTLGYFTEQFERLGFEVWQDPVGTLVASNRPRGRGGVRHRLALRLQPQRRQVGRHARRRGARSRSPAGRRAGPRPAAARDLLPGGGGLGLRRRCCSAAGSCCSASTEEDLRERIRATRTAAVLGAAQAAGYEPERWRESIHELDGLVGWVETPHRAGPRPAGHRQPHRHGRGDRRLRARRHRASTAAPTTPARRRWTSGSTRDPGGRDDRRARAPGRRGRRRRGRHRGRGGDAARASSTSCPAGMRVSLDLRSVTGAHLELHERIVAFARSARRGARRGGRVDRAPARCRRRRWTAASSTRSWPAPRRPASRSA